MKCPLCGKEMEVQLYADWIIYYHPVGIKCSYKIQIKKDNQNIKTGAIDDEKNKYI